MLQRKKVKTEKNERMKKKLKGKKEKKREKCHVLKKLRTMKYYVCFQNVKLYLIYGVSTKKVLHKSEEKMHKKMKMTLQRAENLVHVQQHHGKSFYKKIFS